MSVYYTDYDEVADTSVCCILLDNSEAVVEVIDDPQVAHQVFHSTSIISSFY